MKKSKKPYIITACVSAIVTVVILLGVLYGLQMMPKGSSFSFDTLGVFLGSIGSVGAVFAIWLTTRKQLDEQKQMQKQNVQISKEQNELQKQIVNISEEQIVIQKQNIRIILFEKRLAVYDDTVKFFTEFINANYDIFVIFAQQLVSGKELPWQDTSFTRLTQLFGKESYYYAKKAVDLGGPICRKNSEAEKVYKAIITNLDTDGEFARIINNPFIRFITKHEDQIKTLCDKYILKNFKLYSEPQDYNFYEVNKQRLELRG